MELRFFVLLVVSVLDLLFMINLFESITNDDGDLHNWATLLIEGIVFLPIAFYLANYYFDKEQKEKRQKAKESKELREKTLQKELEDWIMSLVVEITNTNQHLRVTNNALKEVLKSGIVQEEPLKSFKLNKEILDERFTILWEKYQSVKSKLPHNIVNSFAILKSFWNKMNTEYEEEIHKPNPKFNPVMFSMIGATLLQSLPIIFDDSIKFDDSDRQKQFEKFIRELRESYPFKSSNLE